MCGRAYSPRFLFMWPNARISVMGGEQAAKVLVTVKEAQYKLKNKILSEQEKLDISEPLLDKFNRESSCYYASARLWDDGVIDPVDTRKVLGLSLSACMSSFDVRNTRTEFGVFRM